MPSGLCLPDLVGIGNGAVLGDSWGVEIEPCSPFPALRTTRPPEARQMMTMMMRGTEPPARQSKGKPSPILWPIERLLPVGVLIAFCIWAGRIFSLWNRQQYGVALKWNYWMCCVLWGWVGEREEGTCMANPATRVSCFGSNSSSLSGSTSKATEHFSFIILAWLLEWHTIQQLKSEQMKAAKIAKVLF